MGSGVAWGDFNYDGYQDLYVSTPGADYAFQNTGNSFIRAPGLLVNWRNSAGVAWADYDNDGRLDLFVANIQENVLFHNEGDCFTDVANRLFRNDDTAFMEVSTLEGVADSSYSTGCAWGDYDQDGDLDLYVVYDQGQANRLYRNDSSSNHWLILSLVGTESSRDAIGTRVTLYTGAWTQTQQVEGGHGYCSQNSLPLEFGLGSFSQVDSLVIRWTMTERQVFRNLPADQFLTVIEGHQGLGAAVLRVPEDYPTIQQALNAAFAGDTIRVNDGVYQENLIWPATHGLYFTSVHGAQHTIIDGTDSDRVMTIHFDAIDTTTVMEGFTIQNGNAYDGGGISCEYSSPTIRNNIIQNNFAEAIGGGLRLINSRAVISDNIIARNFALYGGGGIYAEKPASLEPEKPPTEPGPIMRHNLIMKNQGDYVGGGIFYRAVWVRFENNTIIENRSKYGGGVFCGSWDSKGTIANNVIFRNQATYEGGGILCSWYSHGILARNHIIQNRAGRLGGGIHYFAYSRINIAGESNSQNDLCHNEAAEFGDELYCDAFEPIVAHFNFWDPPIWIQKHLPGFRAILKRANGSPLAPIRCRSQNR